MKNKVRLAVAAVTLAGLTAAGAGTAAYAHHAFLHLNLPFTFAIYFKPS